MVVVVFMVAWPGASMPTDSEVISASVVSGEISEMAPTVVVFPTPKPPATMIFTGTGAFFGAPPTRAVPTKWSGDCSKSTDHSHDGLGVGGLVVQHMDVQLARGAQVADEDPGDAEVQAQPGGDLRHGQWFAAERNDGAHLRRKPHGRRGVVDGHLGLHPDLGIGTVGAPGRDDERAQCRGLIIGRRFAAERGAVTAGRHRARLQEGSDARPSRVRRVVGVRMGHCWTAFFNFAIRRGLRAPPARVAKSVISYARVP